jgi:hypothetical protein
MEWNLYFCDLIWERCLSGRKEQFAKLSFWVTGTAGSNPALSADTINEFRRQPVSGFTERLQACLKSLKVKHEIAQQFIYC